MGDQKAELQHRIQRLKDQIEGSLPIAEIISPAVMDEILPIMRGRPKPPTLQEQLAVAERQLEILEAAPSAVIPSGQSEDGRTYFTPDGPVQLNPRGAEIIGIMVEQWNSGVENVPIEFIKEKIDGSVRGDTRIRDYVGRDLCRKLFRSGEPRETVRLIHPPSQKNPR